MLVLVLAATASPATVHGAPVARDSLADGTVVHQFVLGNGLRVVTRDVPGSGAVAMTAAYGFGGDHDPEGREGLMLLLAFAHFMAAAGEAPERTVAELESARPLGWNVEVTRTTTRLTEVASLQQFPGVLHQMAMRMRATALTPKILTAAQAEVRGRLARSYRDVIASALYYQAREAAGPGDLARAKRYAAAAGAVKVSVDDLRPMLAEWFVPANAVLSLAGDLSASGMDLDRVLESEFGSIPAGRVAHEGRAVRPDSAVRWVERADVTEPVGVLGVIAPAWSDTSHPHFLLHTVLIGSSFSARWPRTAAIPSRFQYSIFDDPDLVRFYPPVTVSDYELGYIREEYLEAISALTEQLTRPEDFRGIHAGLAWILGGPLTRDLRNRAGTDRGILLTLASNAATRELWGGESFWREYRRRLAAIERPVIARWAEYITTPTNLVQLMFRPAPTTGHR